MSADLATKLHPINLQPMQIEAIMRTSNRRSTSHKFTSTPSDKENEAQGSLDMHGSNKNLEINRGLCSLGLEHMDFISNTKLHNRAK